MQALRWLAAAYCDASFLVGGWVIARTIVRWIDHVWVPRRGVRP